MISRVGHITIKDFEQMIARGEFDKTRERVDLIRGELRFMSPAGPDHSDILTYLVEWSVEGAKKHGFRVRPEQGVRFLELESLPEPDIAWVRGKRYRKAHPTAADVGLVIEVANSSLREDRGEMAELYADAGIGEYWIVNCVDQVVEVHRQPAAGRYHVQFIVKLGEKISPLIAPDALLDVAELFAEEE